MDQAIANMDFTAVVLAAGFGSRISDLTDRPKCLLEINGESLLERNLKMWKELGIKKVHLVLGYKREEIQKVAEKYRDDFEITYYLNEDFRNYGNTHSLYLGIKEIKGACLIFDADLIYERAILEDFLARGTQSEILVGQGSLEDIECAKTLVDQDGFARLTVDKRAVSAAELEQYSFAGEAIGILKFSAAETKTLGESAVQFLSVEANQNLNWEHLLNQYLVHHNVGVHLFNVGKWMEIDTTEDYQAAQEMFKR